MRRRTLTNTHLLRRCQGSSRTCKSGNRGSPCRPKSTWCKVLDGKCKMYIKNLKKMQLTSSWLHVWTACGSSCPEKCKGKIGRVFFLTWWHKHRQPHCPPSNQVGRSSPKPSLNDEQMNMVVISTSQKLSINLGEPSLTLDIVSISHPGPQKRRDPSSWRKMVLVDVVQHLDI